MRHKVRFKKNTKYLNLFQITLTVTHLSYPDKEFFSTNFCKILKMKILHEVRINQSLLFDLS